MNSWQTTFSQPENKTMLKFVILLTLVTASLCCNFDSDCPGYDQRCSSYGGVCYYLPSRLHQTCYKDSDCTRIDIWSECRFSTSGKTCQCKYGKVEQDSGCWNDYSYPYTGGSIALIVLVYTMLPVAIFISIVVFAVRYHRRNQLMTTTVRTVNAPAPTVYQVTPPGPSQGFYNPMAGYQTGAAMPPPPPNSREFPKFD